MDRLEQLFRALAASDREGEGGGATCDQPKVLEEVSVDGIVNHIRKILGSSDCKKILVMTGAGISTSAGIPDFRSPGTGLYDNLQEYNLPNPQAIFDINYFSSNPKPFYHLAKELYPEKYKPTLSHYFIRLLQDKGLLLRCFTQNIDTLERRAGILEDSLVEAHGAFHGAHCITCHASYSEAFFKDAVFADRLPLCTVEECVHRPQQQGDSYRGLVKPDIVFFGERLPDKFAQLAGKDTQECDLLLVMGTSLTVQPFASLASKVRPECPRLLINREKVGEGDQLLALLGMGVGFNFSDTAYRDVFLQGTCDDGVLQLARKLGWEAELMQLYTSEHERLDAQIAAEFKGSVGTHAGHPDKEGEEASSRQQDQPAAKGRSCAEKLSQGVEDQEE